MQVLMIGLGDGVLTGWGDTKARHIDYARRVDHLHMVVYSPRHHDLQVTALSDQLTVYPTRSPNRIAFLLDAYRIGARLCTEHPISLITTQDPFTTGIVGVWLKRRFDVPLNVQNHSDFFDNPAWISEKPLQYRFFNWLGKRVIKRVDTFRVVNCREKQKYIAMDIPAEHIAILPPKIPLEHFQPGPPSDDLRAQLGIPPEACILLWVGRPVPVKNLPLLLEVFAQVRRQRPHTHLVMVGDVTDMDDPHIHTPGRVQHEQLAAYYRLCDVYLHTSHYEGLGRVMIEAAACGRPIVATDTAGAYEIIIDGETGHICTPDEMAAHVIALLEDPVQRQHMGAAGRAHVTAAFDPSDQLDALIDLWRQTAS